MKLRNAIYLDEDARDELDKIVDDEYPCIGHANKFRDDEIDFSECETLDFENFMWYNTSTRS